MNDSPVADGAPSPLETIARSLGEDNPFLDNAVSDAGAAVVDVPEVHEAPFRMLVDYADEVHRRGWRMGQVVWGEAGIGKSHLLARFSRWAQTSHRAVCVFLHNLQPSPEALPRYVLKCVVQRLVEGRQDGFHDTRLYRLLNSLVRRALAVYRPEGSPPTVAQVSECYRRWVDEYLRGHPNAGPDARTVYHVLYWLFASSYDAEYLGGDGRLAVAAVRWLSGDALEPSEARALRLRCPDGPAAVAALSSVDAIESALVVLAQIAGLRGETLVLCFDQVDNLTLDQFRALTQFLHPLIDHAENLLVLLSGVKHKLLQMVEAGEILGAAWDRLAQHQGGVELLRIGVAPAEAILRQRLHPFQRRCAALPAAQAQVDRDPLFPLGGAWFAQRIGALVELRPRDVINWARERWREEQARLRAAGAAAWLAEWPGPRDAPPTDVPSPADEALLPRRIDDSAARLIAEQIERRVREPETLPPDAENLCGLVRRLLEHCVGGDWDYGLAEVAVPPSEAAGRLPTYHLRTSPRPGAAARWPVALTFLATANATSTTAALRRLVAAEGVEELCVLLVTDERQPLVLGARGREYVETLRQRGRRRFRHIELPLREVAGLDALQAVVGQAASGDIEFELSSAGSVVKRVTPEEIVASLHRDDRFRRHPLLGAVLTAPQPADAQGPDAGANDSADERSGGESAAPSDDVPLSPR